METMSTATSRPEYADLMARVLPSVIHSEKENERYLAMLEELDQKGKVSAAEHYPATAGVSLFSWRSRKPASCSRLMDAKSASHIQTRFIFRKRPSRNSILFITTCRLRRARLLESGTVRSSLSGS